MRKDMKNSTGINDLMRTKFEPSTFRRRLMSAGKLRENFNF
jgi:hypothetical protein